MCIAEFGHHQLQQRSERRRRWMLSGRSHVASAGICYLPLPPPMYHPHSPKTCPPLQNPGDLRQIRLGHCRARPANGSRAAAACPEGPFGVCPQGSSSFSTCPPTTPPWELTPQITVQRQRGQDGSLRWRMQHLLTVEGIAQSSFCTSHAHSGVSC